MELILQRSIDASKSKVSSFINSPLRMGVKAILAGMFIAFGGLGSQVINAATGTGYMGAFIFPAGLIFVIITGSELFTGDCTMINGVLDKKIKISNLLSVWVFVYLMNYIGSLFLAFLMSLTGISNLFDGKVGEIMVKVGTGKISLSCTEMLSRGIFCNILVCLAVLMAMKADTIIGKSLLAYIPVMLFVLCSGEHSIANMYFLPMAGFIDNTLFTYKMFYNLFWVTLGNIIGGIFISIMIYIGGKTSNPSIEAGKR